MEQSKLIPLIFTTKIQETRDFYREKLGCELKFDLPDYVHVKFPGEAGSELSFAKPTSATALGVEADSFAGKGIVISLPEHDVDARHEQLKRRGVSIASAPADRPWKWRSFVCRDPNGVLLDFFRPLAQAEVVDAAS
jgi:catechol 2,3-dioxygenase-like lactoylglutathione lyase family enzyme